MTGSGIETDGSVVRLWGEVDTALRGQASAALVRLLAHGGPYVIDAADVAFMDSAGVAFILQLHWLAGEGGTHVVLRDPPTFLVEMLDMIGVPGEIRVELSGS